MAYFMSLQPVTGFNTINNVLKLFKLEIATDGSSRIPGATLIQKFFLVRELRLYFNMIRKNDEYLSFDDIDKLPEE